MYLTNRIHVFDQSDTIRIDQYVFDQYVFDQYVFDQYVFDQSDTLYLSRQSLREKRSHVKTFLITGFQ